MLQLQQAVALVASSTMTRAVILWPGDRAGIELSFARHALHLHAAATHYMSTACASLGQVLVFDRGLPVSLLPTPLSQDDEGILFSGPIIVDVAHTSPHFVSPNQSLAPVEVYVTMWPRGASGVVTLELDGASLAELLINPDNVEQDSFEATVSLPESLPSGTHVVVLRAAIGSGIVAISSVTIVIQSAQQPSKWPHGLPTPEVAYQVALKPPPQTIPSHMISDFTMNHTADVDYMYLPPTLTPRPFPLRSPCHSLVSGTFGTLRICRGSTITPLQESKTTLARRCAVIFITITLWMAICLKRSIRSVDCAVGKC